MFKRILLENWRSHLHTELEFDRGSNVLIGRMGAGKSSVLNAMCFALFGTFPELHRKETTLENVIMDRPLHKDYARVELEFSCKGKNYKVERIVYSGSKTNEAKLYRDGQIIAGPKVSDVNEAIEKIIEINYELFSRAMYAEQNQIDYILRLTPNERKLRFDQLLDLEKYEKVRKNAVTLRNNLKALIDERKLSLNEQKGLVNEAELAELKKQIDEIDKSIETKNRQLKKIAEELEAAKAKMNEMLAKQQKYNELKEKIAREKGSIAMLEQRIARASMALNKKIKVEEKANASNKLKALEAELDELSKQQEELNEIRACLRESKGKIQNACEEKNRLLASLPKGLEDVEKIDKKVGEIEKAIAETKKEIDSSDKNYKLYQQELAKLREKVEIEKGRIKENEEKIEELKKAKASCPTCGQALTAEHKKKLLQEFNGAIANSRANIKVMEESEEALAKNIEDLEKKKAALLQKQNELVEIKALVHSSREKLLRIKDIEQKVAELERSIAELEKKEKGLANVKEHLEKKRAELENIKLEIEAIADAENLQQSMAVLLQHEKALAELGFDEKNALEIKAEFERKNAEKKAFEAAIESDKNLAREKRLRLEEIERRKELIERFEKKIEQLEKIVEKLGLFINSLKATQSELREALIDTINNAMNQLWGAIYPYGDYSGLKLSAGETYELMVKAGDKWLIAQGTLSGGEHSIAALVLRISLSFVLARNLSTLILDEPTHNLDERTVSVLSNMVKETLPKFVEQIFLITHDKEMEKAASATLYLLSKDKEENGITKVELLSVRD